MQLEETVHQLRAQLAESQQEADRERDDLIQLLEQKHRCEALYAEGRIMEVATPLLVIVNSVGENVKANKLIVNWLAGEFWSHT